MQVCRCVNASVSILIYYWYDENEAENEIKMKIDHIGTTWIDPSLDIDTNLLNIAKTCQSTMMVIYVSSNTYAKLEVQ